MPDLKRILKDVIREIRKTGLTVVATICDQGTANEATIKDFMKETKADYIRNGKEFREDLFEIDGVPVVPLFDPPHLLKGVRNNLLKKNLKCIINGREVTAKWQHVVELYKADPGEQNIRILPTLTEEHVNPEKIPKMKVKNAAQIFSQRVSSVMRLLASDRCNIISKDAGDTADVLLFFDELFDSVNANFHQIISAKKYRAGVRASSHHHQLWTKAICVLKTMKFIEQDGRETVPPSIRNWLITIQGFQKIWTYLRDVGFKVLLTRNLNQDPLENFFGAVRSHGLSNNNPTCVAFAAAYKTLLINNLISSKSVGSNCEDDDCTSILENLKSYFFTSQQIILDDSTEIMPQQPEPVISKKKFDKSGDKPYKKVSSIQEQSDSYVTGYLLRKINNNCDACKQGLFASTINLEYHELIKAREYGSLNYPKPAICNLFTFVKENVNQLLPVSCKKKKIKSYIAGEILKIIKPENYTECKCHDIIKVFVDKAIKLLIYSWCREINRIITGKQTNCDKNDRIKELARLRRSKYSRFRK